MTRYAAHSRLVLRVSSSPNLLAEFGGSPQLHQSFHFLLGICGAAGACLRVLLYSSGITIENYSGCRVGWLCSYLPTCLRGSWFRLMHPSDSSGRCNSWPDRGRCIVILRSPDVVARKPIKSHNRRSDTELNDDDMMPASGGSK